jgi:hypothetical protein
MEYSGLWTHKLFRAQNPAHGVRIDYWIKEYTNEGVRVTIEDANGVVVKTLGGSNAPGYNRVMWDLVPEEWQQLTDQGEDTLFTPFHVRPGEYTVKLAMGKHRAEGKFKVLPRR